MSVHRLHKVPAIRLPCSSPFLEGGAAQAARSPSPVQSRNIRAWTAEQSALAGQHGRRNLARPGLDGDQIGLEQELDFGLQEQIVVDAFENFGPDRQAAGRSGAAALP